MLPPKAAYPNWPFTVTGHIFSIVSEDKKLNAPKNPKPITRN